jgi:hypothetical protein
MPKECTNHDQNSSSAFDCRNALDWLRWTYTVAVPERSGLPDTSSIGFLKHPVHAL